MINVYSIIVNTDPTSTPARQLTAPSRICIVTIVSFTILTNYLKVTFSCLVVGLLYPHVSVDITPTSKKLLFRTNGGLCRKPQLQRSRDQSNLLLPSCWHITSELWHLLFTEHLRRGIRVIERTRASKKFKAKQSLLEMNAWKRPEKWQHQRTY